MLKDCPFQLQGAMFLQCGLVMEGYESIFFFSHAWKSPEICKTMTDVMEKLWTFEELSEISMNQ